MAGAPSQLDLFDHKPALREVRRQAGPRRGHQGPAVRLHPARRGGAGAAVQVRQARPVGRRAVGDAAAPGEGRRRHRHRQVGAHRPVQPRPGPDLLQHRLRRSPGRPSIGSWVDLRPRAARPQDLPGVRRHVHRQRASAAARPTGRAGSCRPSTRASGSASKGDPILNVASPPGVDAEAPARLARPDRRPEPPAPRRRRRPGDRHPDRLLRDGLPAADQRPRADGPDERDARRRSTCTAPSPASRRSPTNCLLARRLVERGVRFVNIYHEGWDAHSDVAGNLKTQLRRRPTGPPPRWSRT